MLEKSKVFKVWVVFLSFISGAVNATVILAFSTPVTHQTGNLTQLAIAISYKKIELILLAGFSIFAFCLGSFFAGLMFYDRKFTLKKRYGVSLLACSGLILLLLFFQTPPWIKVFVLALISGLQNGLFITYDNLIIRTTHFTGYLTDASFAIGMVVRGDKSKLKVAFFYIINIFSFLFAGVIFATFAQRLAFYILIGLYFIASFYFFLFRLFYKIL